MHQSTPGERLTAAISALVAIVILGAAVTAQQASAPPADVLATLESDLRFQLDLALRHDGKAYKSHEAQIDKTLAAWQDSPQSADDYRLLTDWFEAAIARTMPGRPGDWPQSPVFGPADDVDAPPPSPPSPLPAAPLPAAVTGPVESEAASAEPTMPAPLANETDHSTIVTPAAPTEEVAESYAATTAPAEDGGDGASDSAEPAEHSITVAKRSAPAEGADGDALTGAAVEATAEEPLVPNVEITPAPVAEPLVAQPPAAEPTAPADVHVNLAELDARIGGYHQQLAETEAAMVVAGDVAPQRLAQMVSNVEELAGEYQFVQLYYDALSDAERRHVATPRSMGDVIALASGLAARDAEATDFLADFDAAGTGEPTLTERIRAVADTVGAANHENR